MTSLRDEARRLAEEEAGSRDWAEDRRLENGNYECSCVYCKLAFIGHKRRATCRICSLESALLAFAKLVLERNGEYRFEMWAGTTTPEWFKMFNGEEYKEPLSIWPIVDRKTCGQINGQPAPDQWYCVATSPEAQRAISDALNYRAMTAELLRELEEEGK